MLVRCPRLANLHSNHGLDNQQTDRPLPKILGCRRANLIGDFSSWMGSVSSPSVDSSFFVPVKLDPPLKGREPARKHMRSMVR